MKSMRPIATLIFIGATTASVGLANAYSDGTITVFEGTMAALATVISMAAFVADPTNGGGGGHAKGVG